MRSVIMAGVIVAGVTRGSVPVAGRFPFRGVVHRSIGRYKVR